MVRRNIYMKSHFLNTRIKRNSIIEPRVWQRRRALAGTNYRDLPSIELPVNR
jgi:hypothetical protein